MKIKPFYLQRNQDVHGVSGTGIVAIGAEYPSGTCVVEWLTFTTTITHFKNLEHVKEIHGHEGATEIIMGDPPGNEEEEPKKKTRRKKNVKVAKKSVSKE